MNVHAVLTGITVLIARSVRCPHLPHVKARFLIRTSPIRAVLKQCNDLLMVGKKTVNIGNALEKLESILIWDYVWRYPVSRDKSR
jgi:hypothetical protein